MPTKNCLLVIVINLVVFGIIEVLSLPSIEIMTAARILTHIGLILNVIFLVLALTSKGRSV
jgi:hypothetical protein